MCNLYEQEQAWQAYCELMQRESWGDPGAAPDLAGGQQRPNDPAGIITVSGGAPRLEVMPWTWPGFNGRPVLNVTSERWKGGVAARGIAPIDAFYEYRGTKAPKEQWRFTPTSNEPQGFAVAIKDGRYVLISTAPGPDVAPIHDRQPAILGLGSWREWLTASEWPGELLKPSPAGALAALQTR